MGLKDNFSQAVKELWKKDGQEGEPAQPGGKEPSELDKYLRGQNDQQPVAGREMGAGGVPLETPYFPNNTGDNAKPQQPAQPTNPIGAVPEQPDDIPPANAAMNVSDPADNVQAQQPVDNGFNRNIAGNFGQNSGGNGYGGNNAGSGYGGNNNVGSGYGGNNNVGAGYNANNNGYNGNNNGYGGNNNGFNGNANAGRFVPPQGNGGAPAPMGNMGGESEETTIISKNTQIEGNIRSLANMTVDGNIKGNVETTRNVDMTGKIVGDIIANNAALNSAAMQGNISLKGRMKMDRDTILIGDLSSQYADINGRIRGKLDIVGKAELKRDAIVFGDINASTIAVTDGAIIQGFVNTTFLSKDDSRNVFPEAISIEEQKQSQGANPAGNRNNGNNGNMGGADNPANPTNPNT